MSNTRNPREFAGSTDPLVVEEKKGAPMIMQARLFCTNRANKLIVLVLLIGAIVAFVDQGSATEPPTILEANQAEAAFGWAVSSAGDVNGDTYLDVIVGAPFFDNGQEQEGAAFVYLGTPYGLQSTPVWQAEGEQAGAGFGWSVALAGDTNNDGFSDIIVGAPFHDSGHRDEGRAYVFLGGPTGPSTSPVWTAEADEAGAHFGWSVAVANMDPPSGFSSIVVGAPRKDMGEQDEGAVFAYRGGLGGPEAAPFWVEEGNQEAAYYGWVVSTAGDVNGDMFPDLIVGAPNYNAGGNQDSGRVAVYHGTSTGFSTAPDWTTDGSTAFAYFGRHVSTAGDVDGDTYGDVLIGAPMLVNDEYTQGGSYIFHGSSGGLSSYPNWSKVSPQLEDDFGYGGTVVGDLNNDGYSDVAIGAPRRDDGENDDIGTVEIYLGAGSGLSPTTTSTRLGPHEEAYLGHSVAGVGDVTGSGEWGVLVGAPSGENGETKEGLVFLFLFQ